jgi:hypothetical protein
VEQAPHAVLVVPQQLLELPQPQEPLQPLVVPVLVVSDGAVAARPVLVPEPLPLVPLPLVPVQHRLECLSVHLPVLFYEPDGLE